MFRTPVGLALAGIVLGGAVLGVYGIYRMVEPALEQILRACGCIGRTK